MELVDEETIVAGATDDEANSEGGISEGLKANEGREDLRLQEESIGVVRGLILKAHPELVEELIVGETLAELMDSVAAAQAAYRRVAEAVRNEVAAVVAPVVPAGGSGTGLVIEDLGADALIKRGLASSRRR